MSFFRLSRSYELLKWIKGTHSTGKNVPLSSLLNSPIYSSIMHEQGKHGDEWGLNIPYNDNILGEDPSRGDQNTLQGVHESPSRPDVPSTIFFTLDGVCSMGAGPYFVLPLWYRRWNSFSPVTNSLCGAIHGGWCLTKSKHPLYCQVS